MSTLSPKIKLEVEDPGIVLLNLPQEIHLQSGMKAIGIENSDDQQIGAHTQCLFI